MKKKVYYEALINFAVKQSMGFKDELIGFQTALHIDKATCLS